MKKIFVLTGEPSGDKLASKVISKIKEDYTGRCDFADVSQMVRERLEG